MVEIILKRKLLTAVLSSLIIALAFSLLEGFEIIGFLGLLVICLIITLFFGALYSFCIDWFFTKILKNKYIREIVIIFFYFIGGAGFPLYGVYASLCFYIVDRLLLKVKISWLAVILALAASLIIFIIIFSR